MIAVAKKGSVGAIRNPREGMERKYRQRVDFTTKKQKGRCRLKRGGARHPGSRFLEKRLGQCPTCYSRVFPLFIPRPSGATTIDMRCCMGQNSPIASDPCLMFCALCGTRSGVRLHTSFMSARAAEHPLGGSWRRLTGLSSLGFAQIARLERTTI